ASRRPTRFPPESRLSRCPAKESPRRARRLRDRAGQELRRLRAEGSPGPAPTVRGEGRAARSGSGGARTRGLHMPEARLLPPREVVAPTGPVTVQSGVTVRDLSQALGVPAPKIIMFMMGLGKAVTITQTLADDEVELIAAELAPEREVTIKHAADEEEEPEAFEDSEADLVP